MLTSGIGLAAIVRFIPIAALIPNMVANSYKGETQDGIYPNGHTIECEKIMKWVPQ